MIGRTGVRRWAPSPLCPLPPLPCSTATAAEPQPPPSTTATRERTLGKRTARYDRLIDERIFSGTAASPGSSGPGCPRPRWLAVRARGKSSAPDEGIIIVASADFERGGVRARARAGVCVSARACARTRRDRRRRRYAVSLLGLLPSPPPCRRARTARTSAGHRRVPSWFLRCGSRTRVVPV